GFNAGSTITTETVWICMSKDTEPTLGTVNNQITLGNDEITSLRSNCSSSIKFLSDSRDKKNISDLSLGLDFIMKVSPFVSNWDKRSGMIIIFQTEAKMERSSDSGIYSPGAVKFKRQNAE
ncbi:MAG: hypothetical protein IPL53_13525, partial [Ignavibacteria bacterium]|nr:hypothetical protein [Ignavibacteria bacterium]